MLAPWRKRSLTLKLRIVQPPATAGMPQASSLRGAKKRGTPRTPSQWKKPARCGQCIQHAAHPKLEARRDTRNGNGPRARTLLALFFWVREVSKGKKATLSLSTSVTFQRTRSVTTCFGEKLSSLFQRQIKTPIGADNIDRILEVLLPHSVKDCKVYIQNVEFSGLTCWLAGLGRKLLACIPIRPLKSRAHVSFMVFVPLFGGECVVLEPPTSKGYEMLCDVTLFCLCWGHVPALGGMRDVYFMFFWFALAVGFVERPKGARASVGPS